MNVIENETLQKEDTFIVPSINWISSTFKSFALQKTPLVKLKDTD